MRVLSISSDTKLFDTESAVAKRQIEYGDTVDELTIIDLSLKKFNFSPLDLSKRVKIFPTNSWVKLFYFFDAYFLGRGLPRPDLITVQDPFETGLTALLLSRYFNCPLQVQVHTDFLSPFYSLDSLKNRIRVLISNFVLPRAVGVRVVSKRIRDSILKKFPKLENKITVLPIFVDIKKFFNIPPTFNLQDRYPKFDFIFLSVGRLEREKNFSLAIDLIFNMVKKYPKIGLIILGDGRERKNLEEKAKRLGLSSNIIFEKWTSDPSSYYKTADLFLSTSNYEGYGMAVVESIVSGLPVLMTDTGIAREIVKDGVNGLVVPVGDLEALSLCAERFINDRSLRQALASGARNTEIGGDKKSYLRVWRTMWDKLTY